VEVRDRAAIHQSPANTIPLLTAAVKNTASFFENATGWGNKLTIRICEYRIPAPRKIGRWAQWTMFPEWEARMGIAEAAFFSPEDGELLRKTLDEVLTILPVSNRTLAMRSRIASRIWAAAAKGERDPVQLRISALLAPADE
jgi:hypothetical protein